MTVLTMLEIATNYPDGIAIDAAQHKETLKWGSFMWMLRDGHYHKLMLSFDVGENGCVGFNSEEEAIKKMEEVRDNAIAYYNEHYKK
jgi:hypothetical protein